MSTPPVPRGTGARGDSRRGILWPVAVAAILLLTVSANVAVYALANDDPSFAVEPDYYRRALRWDDEMAQARANAALGWRLAPALGPMGETGAALVARLADSAGAALEGATVKVRGAHTGRASDVLSATLAASPDAPGAYAAVLPVRRAGQWELRFDVRWRGQHFTATRRVEAEHAARVVSPRDRASAP